MIRNLLVVVSAILLTDCAAYAQNHRNKPIQILHILIVAPDSFDALWNDAHLIALVRVLGNRPEATADGRFVHTAHRARVMDVFKSEVSLDCAQQAAEVTSCAPAVGHELRFLQKAGEIETAEAVIRLADEVPLKAGGEYIVFLEWDAHLKAFLPRYGPAGTYEVSDGIIRPVRYSKVSEEHSGKSATAFMGELRRRGGKR